jgi:pentatricopeptide repeat protein
MPDQNPLSPKIEDLKARLRLDPKSRLFVPLAEELRKSGRPEEAEAVLRSGLEHHSGYLSAWISLGRCLIERGERSDATGALMNALSIDPGNVVAARMLADNYLALGEKVEAIKKLKLVRALLPSDASVEETIASLEKEVGEAPSPSPSVAAEPDPVPASSSSPPAPGSESSGAALLPAEPPEGEVEAQETGMRAERGPAEVTPEPSRPSEMQIAASRPFFLQGDEQEEEPEVGPEEPMEVPELRSYDGTEAAFAADSAADLVSREETSPSAEAEEEPVPFEAGQIEAFPEEVSPMEDASEEGDEQAPAETQVDPAIATLTMADLYARQGHLEAARDIYLRMLERNPSNDEVRRKLDLLGDSPAAAVNTPAARRDDAVRRLESWLQKVGPR